MNATQLAKYLGVSLQTIYTYIKNGVIVPENLNSWQIDNQYIISDEEAGRVKELLRPDGLTTKEVAEEIGCEQRHVISAIDEGRLNAKVRDITKRKQYFVQEDELLDEFKRSFKEEHKRVTKWHDSQHKLYLFQSFFHRTSGTIARIMNLDDLSQVATDQYGAAISIDKLQAEYDTVHEYKQIKGINKPGMCEIHFMLPSHVRALTYDFIEYVISEVGISNVDIKVEERTIIFSVKPSLYQKSDFFNDELIGHVRRNLQKGQLIERKNDFYLDSNDRRINGIVSLDVQQEIHTKAKNEGVSVEEMVGRLLEEVVKKDDTIEKMNEHAMS